VKLGTNIHLVSGNCW